VSFNVECLGRQTDSWVDLKIGPARFGSPTKEHLGVREHTAGSVRASIGGKGADALGNIVGRDRRAMGIAPLGDKMAANGTGDMIGGAALGDVFLDEGFSHGLEGVAVLTDGFLCLGSDGDAWIIAATTDLQHVGCLLPSVAKVHGGSVAN